MVCQVASEASYLLSKSAAHEATRKLSQNALTKRLCKAYVFKLHVRFT